MHAQQDTKRVLPTKPCSGFWVKRAFLGGLMRQQFITKPPFKRAQFGELHRAFMQRLTGAAQRLRQITQARMFGDAVRKPCLTRKPRRGAIIAGQQGAERIKNGCDINRFLQ